MKGRRAMTLVEVIVVTGILLLLVAIVTPILFSAKNSSKTTRSLQNLRQIFLGISMYREDQAMTVDFGPATQMGLPVGLMSSDLYRKLVPDQRIWRSPCCCHKDSPTGYPSYSTYRTDYWEIFHTEEYWNRYVQQWEGSAVLVGDYHCNLKDLNLYFPRQQPVVGLSVRLNGQITKRTRKCGISDVEGFWNK